MAVVPVSNLCNIHLSIIKEYIKNTFYMDVSNHHAVSYAIGVFKQSNKEIDFRNLPHISASSNTRNFNIDDRLRMWLEEQKREYEYSLVELTTCIIIVVSSSIKRHEIIDNSLWSFS